MKIYEAIYTVIIVFFIVVAVYQNIQSDKDAEKICNKTEYFKVINKDYVDVSHNIVQNNYRYVVFIERFDKNKAKIKAPYSINKIEVTKYDYDRLVVNKFYLENEIDIFTYGR